MVLPNSGKKIVKFICIGIELGKQKIFLKNCQTKKLQK